MKNQYSVVQKKIYKTTNLSKNSYITLGQGFNIVMKSLVLFCLMFFATVASADTCFVPDLVSKDGMGDTIYARHCGSENFGTIVDTNNCDEATTFSIKQNCLATVDNDYYDCTLNADGCYKTVCLYESDSACNAVATAKTTEIQKTYPQNSYYCSKNGYGCRGLFLRCDENVDAVGNYVPVLDNTECAGYTLSVTEANQHKLSGETCASCSSTATYQKCGLANVGYNTTGSITLYKCMTCPTCLDTYSGCEDATVSSASKATYENNGYTCTACNKTKTTCYYSGADCTEKHSNEATTETWYKCEKTCQLPKIDAYTYWTIVPIVDCSTLGYSTNSCASNEIKLYCPFDTTKFVCISFD